MSNKREIDDTIFDSDLFFGSEPIVIDEDDAQAILGEDFEEVEEIEKRELTPTRKEKKFVAKKIEDDHYTEAIPPIVDIQEEISEIDFSEVDSDLEKESEEDLDVVEQVIVEEDDEFDDTFFDLPKRKKKAIEKKRRAEKQPKKKIVEVVEEEFVDEDDHEMIVEPQTKVAVKKRRNPFAIVLNLIAVLFFLFIMFETAIAFLNFSLVRQNKEPAYFVTTTKEKRGEFDYTIHDMGLFKIVRKENKKEYEVKLLPFFLDI